MIWTQAASSNLVACDTDIKVVAIADSAMIGYLLYWEPKHADIASHAYAERSLIAWKYLGREVVLVD